MPPISDAIVFDDVVMARVWSNSVQLCTDCVVFGHREITLRLEGPGKVVDPATRCIALRGIFVGIVAAIVIPAVL